MGTLAGKVVLVTGAGRGIGRAAALACAREGASLVLDDLGCETDGSGADTNVVERVRDEIAALGGAVVASALDVTAADAPASLTQLARERFGRLDAVFHAAGIAHEQSLARLLDVELDRVLDVHARAAIRLTRAASAIMQEQPEGGAILLSSGQNAFVGQRGQAAFCAANAAVIGFVRAAALDLRRHRIRINALAAIARTRATAASPMFQSLRADSLTPDQVAQAVVYLLSPLAADVTGECVGAAGTRVYTMRLHESTGAFLEDPLSPAQIANAWSEASKP